MAANLGSTEHASGEQLCRSAPDEANNVREEQLPAVAGRRHLYVVPSAEAPQGPTIVKSAAIPPRPTPDGLLGRSVQGQIGRMLRDAFANVADEPVPKRFVVLLEALEAMEKRP